jgi:sulfopyruvate decarboxylase TPP-binding subunit
MTQVQDAQLSPQIVLDEMKKNGVTHVVWLPDSETNWLYQLMQAEPSLRLVPVSREGLAFSLAAGLATGGQTPIILIQNTPHGIRRLAPGLGLGQNTRWC